MYRDNDEAGVEILRSIVEISSNAYGLAHPLTLSYRVELGFGLRRTDQLPESIKLLERVVPTIRHLLGEHLLVTRALESLGQSYVQVGSPSAAETPYRSAYSMRVMLQGEDHPDTLHTLRLLAAAYRRMGDSLEAERIVREMLPRQIRVFGPRDPEVLVNIQALIYILNMTDRGAEADEWRKRLDDPGEGATDVVTP